MFQWQGGGHQPITSRQPQIALTLLEMQNSRKCKRSQFEISFVIFSTDFILSSASSTWSLCTVLPFLVRLRHRKMLVG